MDYSIEVEEINSLKRLNKYYENEKYRINYYVSLQAAKNKKKLKKANHEEKTKINERNIQAELKKVKKLETLEKTYKENSHRIEKLTKQALQKVETKAEKQNRINKIKALKKSRKELIKEQKVQLSNYSESDFEYILIKNNISNIKFNVNTKIENLMQNITFKKTEKIIISIIKLLKTIHYFFFSIWKKIKMKHPGVAQFLVFFMISNGVTLLQLALMPMFKSIFNETNMININLLWGRIGNNFDGTPYYMFNYPKGPIIDGTGGGLAYFMAVQVTLAIAQIINFFTQRKITFKSDSNAWVAAVWYFAAYIAITLIAAAAQGFYKAPIYNLFMNTFNMGSGGELIADFITMIINSAISFWVFFPIFKVIFKQKNENK